MVLTSTATPVEELPVQQVDVHVTASAAPEQPAAGRSRGRWWS